MSSELVIFKLLKSQHQMKKCLHIFLFIFLIAGVSSNAQPLSGSYTINSAMSTGGTNFQSISDFSSNLNSNGISASVIATITSGSGPYVEQVVFNNIAGTSASNTITLDGSVETITALTHSSVRYIIRLQDMEFFKQELIRQSLIFRSKL